MSAPARKRPASCASRPGPLMPASRQRALSSPAPRAPLYPAASIAASACRASRQKPLTACEDQTPCRLAPPPAWLAAARRLLRLIRCRRRAAFPRAVAGSPLIAARINCCCHMVRISRLSRIFRGSSVKSCLGVFFPTVAALPLPPPCGAIKCLSDLPDAGVARYSRSGAMSTGNLANTNIFYDNAYTAGYLPSDLPSSSGNGRSAR